MTSYREFVTFICNILGFDRTSRKKYVTSGFSIFFLERRSVRDSSRMYSGLNSNISSDKTGPFHRSYTRKAYLNFFGSFRLNNFPKGIIKKKNYVYSNGPQKVSTFSLFFNSQGNTFTLFVNRSLFAVRSTRSPARSDDAVRSRLLRR